jgi:hypothetical protein
MGALIAVFLLITAAAGLLVADLYVPFVKTDALLAGLPVQDLVSLIAAPLLLAAMYAAGRGSARAFVVWAGLLVYVAYYYAFYAFDRLYTAYYPLYLALMGLATCSLIGLLTGVDLAAFAKRVGDRMPVRLISVVMAMPVLFVPLWLSMIAQGINAQRAPEIGTVFVLDLSFLIPAMAFAAVQVWRRRPVGYLLSGVFLVKATISGLLLAAGSFRQMQLGFAVALEELAMYLFLAVVGSLGLVLYLWNLRDRQGRPAGVPASRSLRQQVG